MTNVELIESLCMIAEHQAQIIRTLSMELERMRSLTETEEALISRSESELNSILGTKHTN